MPGDGSEVVAVWIGVDGISGGDVVALAVAVANVVNILVESILEDAG